MAGVAVPDWIQASWPLLVSFLALGLALSAAAHAVLHRRDSRAAMFWVGLVWLAPVMGSVLYFLFGINRIRRRARQLRRAVEPVLVASGAYPVQREPLAARLPIEFRYLESLQRLVEQVVVRPLVVGIRFELLRNGDAAFPSMLDAIDRAERSISVAAFIFNADTVGRRFVARLAAAVARGVAVRVLVDAAGMRYGKPRITVELERTGVPFGVFHPNRWILPTPTMNLRNHRKLLVVDGRVGFTGGMNLKRGNLLADHGGDPVQDTHFRIEGPVVAQLQEVFAEDWDFATGERLGGAHWFPPLREAGAVLARGVAEGPDADLGKLRWCLLGAINVAQRSIVIATPYFLPDTALVSALNVAAMRGVQVDLLVPEHTNVPLVQWAMRGTLWQVLERGCRVWVTPAPFDHTKLMLVDSCWVMLGSANWDARSLRLNFEFNVECYDPRLGGEVAALLETKRAAARRLELAELDSRPLPVRLRDGVARLFSPFL